MQSAHPSSEGWALEGGGHDRDRPQDLAARMRDQISGISVQRSVKRYQTNPPPRRAWPTACGPGHEL